MTLAIQAELGGKRDREKQLSELIAMRLLKFTVGTMLVVLGGCSRLPAALEPKGIAAERIAGLFWLFTGVSALVWLLVLSGLGLASFRRRSQGERAAALVPLD